MDVSGTAGVVAGEGRLELDNTLGVARLDSAQPSVVEVGRVGGIAVSAGADPGVDTL